ncbi:unnamed protein product [Vitrella brassicaformis CCMP3155]|uniref:Uncharacterized protein n=1 Tax=Vitrella brassicaformis (strain CCMP3155) TaxID=1169540 RepID=A0A0G4GS32_VITBC|nr:unnamed protein product [Vitrella brassicaformis CCMP3155]|eukprot:CEM33435.1 unnamed protein product [Vitrella brassicaformis CCMP3155]
MASGFFSRTVRTSTVAATLGSTRWTHNLGRPTLRTEAPPSYWPLLLLPALLATNIFVKSWVSRPRAAPTYDWELIKRRAALAAMEGESAPSSAECQSSS